MSPQPTVYVQTVTVLLHGRPHLRLTYLWRYAATPDDEQTTALQGLRLTLNHAAEPAVWEVLTDDSGADLIFVADSVETAARAEFTAPAPGRRFVSERPWTEATNAVVARVIEDGPTPLGPLVYLRARTRSVSTLTCRCMPAQAKQVVATRVYRLMPVERLADDADCLAAWTRPRGRMAFPLATDLPQPRLEQVLRLPASF